MKFFKLDENLLKNLHKYLITQPLGEVHDLIVSLKQDITEYVIKDLNEYLLKKPAIQVADLFNKLQQNISDAIKSVANEETVNPKDTNKKQGK